MLTNTLLLYAAALILGCTLAAVLGNFYLSKDNEQAPKRSGQVFIISLFLMAFFTMPFYGVALFNGAGFLLKGDSGIISTSLQLCSAAAYCVFTLIHVARSNAGKRMVRIYTAMAIFCLCWFGISIALAIPFLVA